LLFECMELVRPSRFRRACPAHAACALFVAGCRSPRLLLALFLADSGELASAALPCDAAAFSRARAACTASGCPRRRRVRSPLLHGEASCARLRGHALGLVFWSCTRASPLMRRTRAGAVVAGGVRRGLLRGAS